MTFSFSSTRYLMRRTAPTSCLCCWRIWASVLFVYLGRTNVQVRTLYVLGWMRALGVDMCMRRNFCCDFTAQYTNGIFEIHLPTHPTFFKRLTGFFPLLVSLEAHLRLKTIRSYNKYEDFSLWMTQKFKFKVLPKQILIDLQLHHFSAVVFVFIALFLHCRQLVWHMN